MSDCHEEPWPDRPAARDFVSRRDFLMGTVGTALAAVLPGITGAVGAETQGMALTAAPARWPVAGEPYPETEVWAYEGRIPGPELRLRQGAGLRVTLRNRLPPGTATTVHWHGLRLPNAMDGVGDVTQPPVPPGADFTYAFDLPDAGTFWYHPHWASFEQVDRGLAGVLVVEEAEPLPVDRDMVWALDDWRLLRDARIAPDFENMHDTMRAGRLGNTVTVNGRVPDSVEVRAGERIRLRLVNMANARIFALRFAGHRPVVIALDGQPVEPHAPEGDLVILGPGMRADLLLDMAGEPGDRAAVTDEAYPGAAYRLLDLAYTPGRRLRDRPPAEVLRLPPNPLAEPDLARAERIPVVLAGGMMGMMGGGMHGGMMRGMMGRGGLAWTINGTAAVDHAHVPLAELRHGRSYVLDIRNDTAWPHPMHLHGHAFRVLSRNGAPTRHREWRDTALLLARERMEVAFCADNPGDWMFHCHVLEHQHAGMAALLRVL